MNITPQITSKPENDELKAMKEIEFQFILAVLNKDLISISRLLCEKSTFFGKRNKWNLLHFFKVQFENWPISPALVLNVDYYIANDKNIGKRTILIDNGKFPSFGDNKKPKTITLDIKNRIITNLDICYYYISENEFENKSKLN